MRLRTGSKEGAEGLVGGQQAAEVRDEVLRRGNRLLRLVLLVLVLVLVLVLRAPHLATRLHR